MTDLKQSLIKADLSHIKAVAEKWEFSPFDPPDARSGLEQLVEALLSLNLNSRIPEVLDRKEVEALLWLDARGGREHWDRFSRRFGEIREMGAGKLEREQPHQQPISPGESLWYRALIARGFLDTDAGPREFVFIPEDIRQLVVPFLSGPEGEGFSRSFNSRKASTREFSTQMDADAGILDHLCTLLAGLRMTLNPAVQLPNLSDGQLDFYKKLAQILGLVDDRLSVKPEAVRDYFDLSREAALFLLWENWREADNLHDLELVRGLKVEGNPEMDPIYIRDQVLFYLLSLGPGNWWSIESFISQCKEIDPDLLRKNGEYDSWFIKNTETNEYLKGFEHWEDIEGALLRYLITGPLHWLGFLDLGYPEEEGKALAFRLSAYSEAFVNDSPIPIKLRKPEAIQIRSKGEIRMTENVPHKTRYQVARFCDWFPIKAEAHVYAITPASLKRAEEQGLRVAHLLSLFKKNIEAIPPNILAALERWEKGGVQASIAQRTVLRLGSPQILKTLKKSKASRYILEQLGPTAVVVKDGSEEKIAEALVELGFFLEIGD